MMDLSFLGARMVGPDKASLDATRREVLEGDCYGLQGQHSNKAITTVLDIGANVGCFTILAQTIFPRARIVAVEPHPANYAALKQNIETAGIAGKVETAQLALGDGRPLRCSHDQHGGGCARFDVDGTGVVVQSATLSGLLRHFGITPAGLYIKLDCEGGEAALLTDPAAKEILASAVGAVMELHCPPDRAFIARWREFFAGLEVHPDCDLDVRAETGGNALVRFGKPHAL